MERLFDVGSFLDGLSGSGRKRLDPDDFFSERRRRGWHMGDGRREEPRCCLDTAKPHLVLRGITAHAQWQRSVLGPTLSDIKASDEYVDVLAEGVTSLVHRLLGENLHLSGWAVTVPPPRRHREMNFATRVGRVLADLLKLPFYGDVAKPPRTRQRIAVDYELDRLPEERNIIVFDDIVTTGSTLASMGRLLAANGRTVVNVVGIDNH